MPGKSLIAMENLGMELTDAVRAELHRQLTTPPAKPAASTAREYRFREYTSDALGVHPSQRKEATEHLRAHGCTASYNSDGQLVVGSERQFLEVAKISGMWDGRDGYGVRREDGSVIRTGREQARAQAAARERIRSIIED
jgi:hypothetical protein